MDKGAFLTEVQKYVNLSPVFAEWKDVQSLDWPSALVPPKLWKTLPEIIQFIGAVCAAVELAKIEVIKKEDPDGTKGAKFDRELALRTAVTIFAAGVRFGGVWGWLPGRIWFPIMNLLISIYVSQRPADWAALAVKILRIALVTV
jgi:hypothetical protein